MNKAVFFDLDDTLHDHMLPFTKALKDSFPMSAKALPIETIYKRFREFSDHLWVGYSSGELSLEDLRVKRILMAFDSLNIKINTEEARRFQENYESHSNHLELFPDVPKLLQTLNQYGYKVGIITNGPVEHQWNKISYLGLPQLIPSDFIFISDGVGIAKPNPSLFTYVEKKVNLPGSNLTYVGDSWVNDVVAPMEAGWKAIWYNHRKRQPGKKHVNAKEIESLSEILRAIDS